MVYQIDVDKLEQYNLTLGDVLLYLAEINGVSFEDAARRMLDEGEADPSMAFNGVLIRRVLSERVKQFLLDCTPTKSKDEELLECARRLKEIYPSGKNPRTGYYWADSPKLIVDRLKMFFKRYGEYPLDDVIEATERYVRENSGRPYMRILKYFIIKNDVKTGEVERASDLLNYLENKNEENNQGDTDFVTLF